MKRNNENKGEMSFNSWQPCLFKSQPFVSAEDNCGSVVPPGEDFQYFYGCTGLNGHLVAALIPAQSGPSGTDIVLETLQEGALARAVPDQTIVGGNCRGPYALDFQASSQRSDASQVAAGAYSSILNGYGNAVDDGSAFSLVGGGHLNEVSEAVESSVVNGDQNVIRGATGNPAANCDIHNGVLNEIVSFNQNTTSYDVIGNGYRNSIQVTTSAPTQSLQILNGNLNVIQSFASGFVSAQILNGSGNNIENPTEGYCTIGNGLNNSMPDPNAFCDILNGNNNLIANGFGTTASWSSVGNGSGNRINSCTYATVSNGVGNSMATSSQSEIGNGSLNSVQASQFSGIDNGSSNAQYGCVWTTIGNGSANQANDSTFSSIVNGGGNQLNGCTTSCVVLNGNLNIITSSFQASILNGDANTLPFCKQSTIGNGVANSLQTSTQSDIGNGSANTMQQNTACTIGNGTQNSVTNSFFCDVGNGVQNTVATSSYCDVGNGVTNRLTNATYGSILNGDNNTITNNSHVSVVNGRGLNVTSAATYDLGCAVWGHYNYDLGITGSTGLRLMTIGNGANNASRSNAASIDSNGSLFLAGSVNINGPADLGEYFESWDGQAIPAGTPVYLFDPSTDKGDRIVALSSASTGGDLANLVGVVSKTAGVLLHSAEEEWHGRFERAADGSHMLHEYDVPSSSSSSSSSSTVSQEQQQKKMVLRKQSAAYDPSRPYVPRSQRPEWHVVGLTGRVKVLKQHSEWMQQQRARPEVVAAAGPCSWLHWKRLGPDRAAPNVYDLWFVR
jgi:hypothetical protein